MLQYCLKYFAILLKPYRKIDWTITQYVLDHIAILLSRLCIVPQKIAQIAKERLSIFQRVADEIKRTYREKLVNSTTRVLFENNTRDADKYFGRDEYFNSVIVNSNENLTGKIRNVKIDKCNQNTLFGEVILEDKPKEYAA